MVLHSASKSQEYASVGVEVVRRRSWDKPHADEIREIRLHKTGQISIAATLPWSGMGALLDAEELPRQVAEMLRLVGALNVIQVGHIATAAGVSANGILSIGRFDLHHPQRTAQPIGFGSSASVYRTEPDESVSLAALDSGADEVGRNLSRALFAQIQR